MAAGQHRQSRVVSPNHSFGQSLRGRLICNSICLSSVQNWSSSTVSPRRVSGHLDGARARAELTELGIFFVMEQQCSYKSSRSLEEAPDQRPSGAARSGRKRRRGRSRPWLGLRFQNRVAQPSEFRRAVPGRGHRGRRILRETLRWARGLRRHGLARFGPTSAAGAHLIQICRK